MTKQDLEEILVKFGYVVSGSVTKDCYALITAGDATSKVAKAEQYGIPVINYWQNKREILQGIF